MSIGCATRASSRSPGMGSRGLIITIAGVLTAMFILPVKAEELVIWTRTNQAAEDKALKKTFAEFEAANAGVTIKRETRSVDEQLGRCRILLG